MNENFFFGVVEDIDDPLQAGRVRVRVIGHHSSETIPNDTTGQGLATDDLPWSQVMLPTTASGVHGFKGHPGLLEGAWVCGFSRDGEVMNDLVVMGSLPGIPEEKNPNPKVPAQAYHGKGGEWPAEEFLSEPDMPRLARGKTNYKDEKYKAPSEVKTDTKKTVSGAGGLEWKEKPSESMPVYGKNTVFQSPGGHIIEVDDTPGYERIAIFHGISKTYIDLLPDGSMSTRINGDDFAVVVKDKNLSVEGALSITVVGDANIMAANVNVEATSVVVTAETATVTAPDITLDGDTTISGRLDVSGAVSLSSTLGVSGKTSLASATASGKTSGFKD